MEKYLPCTIYCGYQKGRIVPNIVRDIEDFIIAPEASLMARIGNNSMARFYTGIYREDENIDLTDAQLNDKPAKWGFINILTGEIVVPPIYEYADDYYCGRALIKQNAKYGIIDQDGEIVVPSMYEYVGDFYCDRALVKLEAKYGFIDQDGKIVVPPIYDNADPFYGDSAVVKKGEKYGVINTDGSVAVDIVWDQVSRLSRGRCAVKKDHQWFYVNNNGEILPDLRFDAICTIYDNGYDGVSSKHVEGVIVDNTVYCIGKDDSKVPPEYFISEYFNCARVRFFTGYSDDSNHRKRSATEEQIVNEPAKWGYFDLYIGEIEISPIYDYAGPFCGDIALALVERDGKLGHIDLDGGVVGGIIWDGASSWTKDLSAVRKDNLWGYINRKGEIIVDPIYDDVGLFDEGYDPFLFNGSCVARVKKAEKWGWINESGLIVVEPIYDDTEDFKYIANPDNINYFASRVKKDGKFGFLNEEGTYISKPTFEEAFEFWDFGYAAIKNHGKWSLIDRSGENITDSQFEDVGEYYGKLDSGFLPRRRWGTSKNGYGQQHLGSTDLSLVYITVKKDGLWGIMDLKFNVIMPESNNSYCIFKGSKIYLKNGDVTSTRKIKAK